MKLTPNQAALISASERALMTMKGPWHIKTLVTAIKRMRALRDKQRDLLQRQSIAATRSSGARSASLTKPNSRTAAKGDLFARALDGFESELRELDAQSSAAAKALGKPDAKRSPKSITKKAAPPRAGAGRGRSSPRVAANQKVPGFPLK